MAKPADPLHKSWIEELLEVVPGLPQPILDKVRKKAKAAMAREQQRQVITMIIVAYLISEWVD